MKITSSAETEAITSQKLVKGHAYSVTGAETVNYQGDEEKLIRIRNPWGQVEWTGSWCDEAPEWDCIPGEERDRLRDESEDGEFWMSFTDFLQNFSRVEICNLTPDTLSSEEVHKWSMMIYNGTWRSGSTAGGCRNYPRTFWTNPQFKIQLDEADEDPADDDDKCSFLVGVIQKNRRKQRKMGQDMHTIGFAIYEVPDEYKDRTNIQLRRDFFMTHAARARSETFINLREVMSRLALEPGQYFIVPSTFEPHKNGDFAIRLFTEKQTDVQVIDVEVDARLEDEEVDEDDISANFETLFDHLAGQDAEISSFELQRILNRIVSNSVQEKMGIMNRGVVYALWDYDSQTEDELSFKEGDCMSIIRREDEAEIEWWWARLNDGEGYVSRNLLGLMALAEFCSINQRQLMSTI
ncbi:calpain-2 catalytic subunit-like [Rhincodon typus]|uniref:calpain-2 catalytic subunit-like n=1 Tax=Rhincodon typus TaxID=259920 RepID=UPI00202EDBCC|nr:calpain-2 catalytic subunit-like [Rhincodon typus]